MSEHWHYLTWNGSAYEAEPIDLAAAEEILRHHSDGVIDDGTEHPDRIAKIDPSPFSKMNRVSFDQVFRHQQCDDEGAEKP